MLKEEILKSEGEVRVPWFDGGVVMNDEGISKVGFVISGVALFLKEVHGHVPARVELSPVGRHNDIETLLVVPSQVVACFTQVG